MSETQDTDDPDARSPTSSTDHSTSDQGELTATTDDRTDRFRSAVNYLVLAGLALTVLVAGVQFYTSAMTAISRFVAREFQPVVRAVFNLGLAVLAVAGVSIQLRRLRG